MSLPPPRKEKLRRWMRLPLILLFVIWMCCCATNPSPDAAGPRASAPTYPILLADDDGDIRAAALAAWTSFTRRQGIANAPAPELQPFTATLNNLPTLALVSLYLPKVGESSPMSEEETRESLRRFIAEAGPLLCSDPQQLSLTGRVDRADGVKEARYEQRPFRYFLHGNYGKLQISFMSNRRITGISSTCIPKTEQIRRGIGGLGQQRITADNATKSLVGVAVTYAGDDGQPRTYVITDKDKLNARELVIYPIERLGHQPVLEFHVAWEIIVESPPGLTIYLDSIVGDILGTQIGRRS